MDVTAFHSWNKYWGDIYIHKSHINKRKQIQESWLPIFLKMLTGKDWMIIYSPAISKP